MKVILTRDVPRVGKDGDIVLVADGYARNYLFPRQLAIVAKGAAMKQHEARLAREKAKSAELLAAAQANAEKLKDQRFQILVKTAPKSNRLFGAVTEADVVEVILKQTGVTVDKRRVSLVDPIKLTGIYDLTARLHVDVTVPFSIDIVTTEILEQREKVRLAEEERLRKEAEKLAAIEAAKAAAAAAKEANEATAPA